MENPATERLKIEEMLSVHEARYGASAGRIIRCGKGGVHAVETWSKVQSFSAPSCDFHRFNFQLSGRMTLMDFALAKQTSRKPSNLTPGNFAYIPSGTRADAKVEGDPFHVLQIMIPRQNMQRALEHVTGKPVDDDLMYGHIGSGSATLLWIGQLLRQEHANPKKGSPEMLESMTNTLCIELARQFGQRSTADTAPDAYAPLDETHLNDMMAKAIPGVVSISDMADAFGLLPYQFTRRFKAQFAETPRDHLMRRRLERARQLLSETRKPLAEIAFECGFSSQAHMTSAFSKTYGTSPGRIRCHCDTTLQQKHPYRRQL